MLSTSQLSYVMPKCPAAMLQPYAAYLGATMAERGINTVYRASAFLAQLAHESEQLLSWEEKLTYSAKQLVGFWPNRFTPELAASVVGNREKIANIAYANRDGNGPPESGDGWRYRGRGPIQLTLKDNYAAAGLFIGLDLVKDPDLVLKPEVGFKVAGWFWVEGAGKRLSRAAKTRVPVGANLNDIADKPDFEATTLAINGGLNGQADRLMFYNKLIEVLCRTAILS